MHEILFEGIRDVVLPCSLMLWLPALAVTLSARRRAPGAAAAAWVAASMVTWARAAGWWSVPTDGVWVGLGAGVVLLGAVWLVWPMRFGRTLAGGAFGGVVAAWLWQPCVGRELGAILSEGPSAPLSVLLPSFLYIGGAFVVLWLVLAVRAAARPSTRFEEPLGKVGVVMAAMLSATMVIGLYDEVAGTLYRWSV